MIFEARAVTVRYRGASEPALEGVSCSVAPARLVAVVGPNGCGKTTLVRALAGLLPLERGEVLLENRPIEAWSREALARVLAVVPQREEVVFPLRVREMVMLGRYARLGPFSSPHAADHEAVDAALRRCDITALADRPTDALSGGEWQRVRIARALAQTPRALILDEPTASLDIRHEMELFELTRELVDGGLAGLVITHHLNLAARFADQVLLLHGGRLIAAGTPQEVIRQEVLSPVFRWPVAVTTWSDGAPQVVPLRAREAK